MDATKPATEIPWSQRYNDADTLTNCGLRWSIETVNRQPGGNGAQKTVATNDARILVIDDVTKFVANFPDGLETLGGIGNSTSLRVKSQHENRHNPKMSADERMSLIWNWLLGAKNASVRVTTVERIVEKVIREHRMPDGTLFDGTVEIEYRAAYMAALHDMGVANDTARNIANGLVW